MRKLLLLAAVIVGAVLLLAQPEARAGNPCTVPASSAWGPRIALVFRGRLKPGLILC